MKKILIKWAAVLALGSLLSACDSGQKLTFTPESKINAAFPLMEAARNMKTAVFEAVPPAQRKDLEAQFDARMKLRALNCAKDYAPSWYASSDTIRKKLENRTCFSEADQELAKWLGFRRLGFILAKPALKPVPANPPALIAADSFIGSARFAADAGIALLETQQGLQILDLGSGQTLFKEPRGISSSMGQLSPNGQVFAMSEGDRLKIRESESGTVLLELPLVRAYEFFWLDNRTVLYNKSDSGRAFFVDLSTGKEAALLNIGGGLGVQRAMRVAGEENQYILYTHRGATKVALVRDKPELTTNLIADKSFSGVVWASNTSDASADQNYFFASNRHLTLVSSKTLEIETIQLDPFYLQTGVATPDPDKIIVTGFLQPSQGETPRNLIYSIQNRTILPIDIAKLPSQRFVNVPSLRRTGAIVENKIVLFEGLPTLETIPATKFVGDMLVIANQRKIDALDRQQRLSYETAPSSDRITANAAPGGPLSILARDALVEAVGVYQGTTNGERATGGRKMGYVEVRIRRSAKPVVLVLSSYEPVRWMLITESGARLAAVLVSGYHPSQVVGAGNARVLMAGSAYAYAMGNQNYRMLNQSVVGQIGKGIDLFQGRYEGGSFSVGGL